MPLLYIILYPSPQARFQKTLVRFGQKYAQLAALLWKYRTMLSILSIIPLKRTFPRCHSVQIADIIIDIC
jgi:hypothetical protein